MTVSHTGETERRHEYFRLNHVQDLWQLGGCSCARAGYVRCGFGWDRHGDAGCVRTVVDVEVVLSDLATRNQQQLNWRTSIVDLMKLLNLDSSVNARQELAQELHYDGDMNDSAAMNIWLHKQVMIKLADNGGKVPDDLKS